MKILLILFLFLVSCTNTDHLRKVQVVDENNIPIKGVTRWPVKMLFDRGGPSNRKGFMYVTKDGGVILKDGFIPLNIKSTSQAEVYFLKKDTEGRSWNVSNISDIKPSQ